MDDDRVKGSVPARFKQLGKTRRGVVASGFCLIDQE